MYLTLFRDTSTFIAQSLTQKRTTIQGAENKRQ